MPTTKRSSLLSREGVTMLLPFILITSCFALWGFANDVTTPMVKAFSKIFRMSVTEGAMVQVASYLGYFVMAFPAALVIQRYSFKTGVIIGLSLFAAGALLFLPARLMGFYWPFLMAYFVLTCGLSFLETSCNPYIYVMGSEETATRRLNLAQAFNPIGNLFGMYVAMEFVQSRMSPMSSAARHELPLDQFEIVKDHDLGVLVQPYIYLGIIVALLLVAVWLTKMPKAADTQPEKSMGKSLRELIQIRNYSEGVLAQFFYVGAQVTCWTFIIQYGTRVFMAEGMEEKAAEILSQRFNIVAMVLFTLSRFICTYCLKYIAPSRLLSILAVVAGVATIGVVCFTDRNGMYCLVAISACMSLMFPTIYGIALHGVGDNVKFAGAGLIMAILGGSFFPPIQAMIIDTNVTFMGLPATNLSFVIPLICFVVVAIYGHRSFVRLHITHRI
jgi:FHS family L-fucose permease-like MFS transporter